MEKIRINYSYQLWWYYLVLVMQGTDCALLHSALSTERAIQYFPSEATQKQSVHVEPPETCREARLPALFSCWVFTRVMINLSVIYYKYISWYLIIFLCMKYAVIGWI